MPDWALAVNMHFKCIPKDNLIFSYGLCKYRIAGIFRGFVEILGFRGLNFRGLYLASF